MGTESHWVLFALLLGGGFWFRVGTPPRFQGGGGQDGDSLHFLGRHTLSQVTPIHSYKGTGQQNRITRSQKQGRQGPAGRGKDAAPDM